MMCSNNSNIYIAIAYLTHATEEAQPSKFDTSLKKSNKLFIMFKAACSTHARQKPQHPKVQFWPIWPKLRKWALQWPRCHSKPWTKPYTLNPTTDMAQVAEMSKSMSQIPLYLRYTRAPTLHPAPHPIIFLHQYPLFQCLTFIGIFGRWVQPLGLLATDPPLGLTHHCTLHDLLFTSCGYDHYTSTPVWELTYMYNIINIHLYIPLYSYHIQHFKKKTSAIQELTIMQEQVSLFL